MKIDLNKLYYLEKLEIKETISIPKTYYKNSDIKKVSTVKVKGSINVEITEEIIINLIAKGTFTLKCALSLEEVFYDFNCNIEESIKESDLKNQQELDILDLIWENIVLEVPIRVVKKGVTLDKTSGDGWELE